MGWNERGPKSQKRDPKPNKLHCHHQNDSAFIIWYEQAHEPFCRFIIYRQQRHWTSVHTPQTNEEKFEPKASWVCFSFLPEERLTSWLQSPWYDLRGWLCVKNQSSIYLSLLCCMPSIHNMKLIADYLNTLQCFWLTNVGLKHLLYTLDLGGTNPLQPNKLVESNRNQLHLLCNFPPHVKFFAISKNTGRPLLLLHKLFLHC